MRIFFFRYIVWLEMCDLSSPAGKTEASNLTAKVFYYRNCFKYLFKFGTFR